MSAEEVVVEVAGGEGRSLSGGHSRAPDAPDARASCALRSAPFSLLLLLPGCEEAFALGVLLLLLASCALRSAAFSLTAAQGPRIARSASACMPKRDAIYVKRDLLKVTYIQPNKIYMKDLRAMLARRRSGCAGCAATRARHLRRGGSSCSARRLLRAGIPSSSCCC
jgi:hypothetical protein